MNKVFVKENKFKNIQLRVSLTAERKSWYFIRSIIPSMNSCGFDNIPR